MMMAMCKSNKKKKHIINWINVQCTMYVTIQDRTKKILYYCMYIYIYISNKNSLQYIYIYSYTHITKK